MDRVCCLLGCQLGDGDDVLGILCGDAGRAGLHIITEDRLTLDGNPEPQVSVHALLVRRRSHGTRQC